MTLLNLTQTLIELQTRTKLEPNYNRTTTKLQPNYNRITTKLVPNYNRTSTELQLNYNRTKTEQKPNVLVESEDLFFLPRVAAHRGPRSVLGTVIQK